MSNLDHLFVAVKSVTDFLEQKIKEDPNCILTAVEKRNITENIIEKLYPIVGDEITEVIEKVNNR